MRRRRKKRRPPAPSSSSEPVKTLKQQRKTNHCWSMTNLQCLLALSVLLIQVTTNIQVQAYFTMTNRSVIAPASEKLSFQLVDRRPVSLQSYDRLTQRPTPSMRQRQEWSLSVKEEEEDSKTELRTEQQSVLEADTSWPARSLPVRNGRRDKRQAQQDKSDAERQFSDADSEQPPTLLEDAGANLAPGSRVVATSAGQSVELTCNALDAALSAAKNMRSANQKDHETPARRQIGQLEFVVGPNGTLRPLDEQLAKSFVVFDRANRTLEAQLLGGLLDVNVDADDDELASAGSLSRHLKHLNVHDYLVALVFWYKDSNPAPIYTLDARPATSQVLAAFAASTTTTRRPSNSSASEKLNEISELNGRLLAHAKHYRSQQALYGHDNTATSDMANGDLPATPEQPSVRQHEPSRSMRISVDWPLIRLRLEAVDARHAGDFKCRVDFRRARTIRQLVRLLVQVPMKRLELNYSSEPSDNSSDRNRSEFRPTALTNNVSVDPVAHESGGGHQHQVRIIRMNEDQKVNFECRASDGTPPAQHSWMVAWPERAVGQSIEQPVASWLAERPLNMETNSTIWSSMGANSGAGPNPIGTRDNWPNRSAKSPTGAADLAAAPNSAAGIQLELKRVARAAHRLRLGCRARQVLQFSAPKEQPTHSLSTGQSAADARSKRRVAPTHATYQPAESQEINLPGRRTPLAGHQNNRQKAPKPQDDDHEQADEVRRKRSLQNDRLVELTKWVEFELNLKPELVEILYGNISVAAARRRQPDETMMNNGPSEVSIDLHHHQHHQSSSFVCRARGSLPAASLQWFWLAAEENEPKLIESSEQVRVLPSKSGGSESEILFAGGLGSSEHLKTLACRATNHQFAAQISDRALEARVKLDVKFKPIVQLIGENSHSTAQAQGQKTPLEMQSSAGSHVKLHCNVQSNPAINQLVWLVNGRTLARVALINKPNAGGSESSGGQKYGSRLAQVELFDQAEIKQFRLELDALAHKDERSLEFQQDQVSYQLDLSQLANNDHSDAYLNNVSVQLNVKWLSQEARQMGPNERPRDKIKLSKWAPADGKGISQPPKDIQFECSASNGFQETGSDTLALPAATFDNSKCLRAGRHLFVAEREQPLEAKRDKAGVSSASLLDSIEAHQAHSWPVERLVCHRRQARRSHTSRFLWSFVPAQRVALDYEGQLSALAIERQVETNSSELVNVRQLMPVGAQGLILCQEFVGLRHRWQEAPCIILVSASADEESHVPDVRKCQVEPLLVGANGDDDEMAALTPTRGQIYDNSSQRDGADATRRLAIGVDCGPQTATSGALILAELAVGWAPAARKEVARDNQKGSPTTSAPVDGSSSTFETFALFKGATEQQARRSFARLIDFSSLVSRLLVQESRPVDTAKLPPSDPDYATKKTSTTNEQLGARGQQQTAASNASSGLPSLQSSAVERKAVADGADDDGDAHVELDNEETRNANQLQGDQALDELNSRRRHQSLGANETTTTTTTSRLERMKLSEQVALLNELEFTLRLGDLIHAPTERRTIPGAQMKLVTNQRQEAESADSTTNELPVGGQSAKAGGVAQVSRSATPQLTGADDIEEQPAAVLVPAAGLPTNPSLSPTRATVQASYNNYRTTLMEWGRQHEIGITMAAIGATLTLSLLTLALIILVARSRQSAASSPPPSFTSTTTTSAGTNANKNTNSSPSNSNESNSAASVGHQQEHQHEHQLRHFLLATGDPAPSSVSSYSSPAPPAGAINEFPPEFIQTGDSTLLAPYERGQSRLLDLRHFQQAASSPPIDITGKQLVFDCDGLIVMSECSAAQDHALDLDLNSMGNYHLEAGGNFYHSQMGAYNPNNSLQESCTSVTETTISPTTIDFLAPPATSCHSNQNTMRRNHHHLHHHQQRL